MKLWLLKPVEGLPDDMNPWDAWYDCAHGFVVRAESEEAARVFASAKHGDEGGAAWFNPKQSTCTELTADGEPGVILRDFNAG